MLVYWDLAMLWNFALDYLLLRLSALLVGVEVKRRRLVLAALFGAAFAVAVLFFPRAVRLLLPVLVLICILGFADTGRFIRLSLLFLLLSCVLAGAVLLIGGGERLSRGLFYGELPWGVFFAAAALCYLLLGVVFRGGAVHRANDFVRATLRHGEGEVSVRLLCDTGNSLRKDGDVVPVIERQVLRALNFDVTQRIPYTAVGVTGELECFCCDELLIDGVSLGTRLVALSPAPLGAEFQGLWCAREEKCWKN